MSRSTSVPLVRCRACGSGLLQPLSAVDAIDGTSIVARHCPECDRRDFVVADDIAVQAWLTRDRRIAAWMAEVADSLATDIALGENMGRR